MWRLALLAAVLFLAPSNSGRAAATCGLPEQGPLWIDYAGHDAPIAPKPGMILAVSSGTTTPAAMRQAGAATIFFDLHLNARVGTPSAPADPATIAVKAKAEFDFAVQVTGCATPLIAENELFGAQTPTPWTATTVRYRANVLALLQALNALGATTAITIANPPYTGDTAADWWREAAKGSILVRQVYFTSPGPKGLLKRGPLLASRALRQGMRGLVTRFGQIGIPASRVALELQFQSAAGQGGRQGLQPRSAWLEFVKLEALAARQVAADTKVQGIWSWGWPTFSAAGADPDKPAAACVYLWTREASLCDGPGLAGAGFDTSLTEGQIALEPGIRCTFGGGSFTRNDVARAGALSGDLGAAASALLQRVLLRAAAPVSTRTVLAAERAIIRDRFGGSAGRYRAALAAARVTLADARAILADRLGREQVEQRFRPRPPTAKQVDDFLTTYAATRVRLVSVDAPAPWLGYALRAYAVDSIAPEAVFGLALGRATAIDTIDGRFTVRPLGPALPLYALSQHDARSVAAGLLRRFAADAVYESWLHTQETRLLQTAVCARDQLPAPGDVDLGAWVPFLDD
jgi:hypothetical protein